MSDTSDVLAAVLTTRLDGGVVWITGVPSTGKSTLARGLVGVLAEREIPHVWLDSDDLRVHWSHPEPYSDDGRAAFYQMVAHLARVGCAGGAVVVVSATAARRKFRDQVRQALPADQFVEIWLDADPEVLGGAERDAKGLYAAARAGDIAQLPGAGGLYERPHNAELALDTTVFEAAVVLRKALAWLDGHAGWFRG